MALNKKNRLKKKKDFEAVFKKGKAVRSTFLFARYLENNLGFPRVAFVVSSKVSKKAVVRNRIRRIIAEVVSKNLKNIQSADIIVVTDKKIAGASKEGIAHDADNIFSKIR